MFHFWILFYITKPILHCRKHRFWKKKSILHHKKYRFRKAVMSILAADKNKILIFEAFF
jgi:hypothetical protein